MLACVNALSLVPTLSGAKKKTKVFESCLILLIRYEFMIYRRSYTHNLRSCEI